MRQIFSFSWLNSNLILKHKIKAETMTGCQIGDDVVEVGDFIDFTDLGVRLTCKSGGVVEPSSTPVISYKGSSINDVTYINIYLLPPLCQERIVEMEKIVLKCDVINRSARQNVIGAFKPHTHVFF